MNGLIGSKITGNGYENLNTMCSRVVSLYLGLVLGNFRSTKGSDKAPESRYMFIVI